jgi:hypothetical protein
MSKALWILCLLLTVAGFSVGWSDAATPSATPRPVRLIGSGDSFYNYDFTSLDTALYAAGGAPRADGVDWALDLIFWNGATINGVKNRLDYAYHRSGDHMWAAVNDGDGYVPDEDGGRKEIQCPFFTGTHYRIYAPRGHNDHLTTWKLGLGFYVVGTLHRDHAECNPFSDKWSGKQEEAERKFAVDARKEFGRSRVDGHFGKSWNNVEGPLPDGRNIDGHWWQSDGYALGVKVRAKKQRPSRGR